MGPLCSSDETQVCHRSYTIAAIAPLKENGNLYGDPKTKAKLLNSQFSSVFSTDSTSNIPDLRTSQYNEAPHITVTSPKMVHTNCYMA